MLLKWVVLENIRSYTHQRIEFPLGSTLLSGDIGSGKSSILLAIEFALFGTKRKELSGNALLRTGTKHGFVELCFELDKNEIIIKRVLKRGKDSIKQDAGYLIVNGIKKDLTAVELKTHILDMLGYPKELVTKSKDLIFRYTVYTPQEQMKAIILEEKEVRLDTLRRVFGIDKYKRIRENAGIYTKSLREKQRELEGKIFDLAEKKKQLSDNESELKEINEKIVQLKPKLDALKNNLHEKLKVFETLEIQIKEYTEKKKTLELKIESLQSSKDMLAHLEKAKATLDKELKDMQKSIESVKKAENIDEELLEKELIEKEKLINNTTSSLLLLEEKRKNNETKIVQLKADIERKSEINSDLITNQHQLTMMKEKVNEKNIVKNKITEARKKLSQLIEALKENDVLIKNASETISQLQDLDKCPTCMQDVEDVHKNKIITEHNEKISVRKKSIEHITAKKASLEEEQKRLEQTLEQMAKTEQDIAGIKAAINNMQDITKDIVAQQKQYSKLAEELKQFNKDYGELSQTDMEFLKSDVNKKQKLLKEAREYANLNRILAEKEKNHSLLAKQIEDSSKQQELLNRDISQLTEKIKNYDNIEKAYSDLKLELDQLRNKEKTLEIQNAEHEKEKESVEKTISLIKKEVEKKKKDKEKIKDISNFEHWLSEHFTNLMAVMERQVMLKLYQEFTELFQSWFGLLMEDTITARLDEEFTPIVEQNGYEMDVENLSGGEKTALALAYRLSLNQVINDFISDIKTRDIIILDEPTDGFSTEQLDRVRDVLDQLKVKQIIIVSHENKVESFVNNVIRIHKEEHESKVLTI